MVINKIQKNTKNKRFSLVINYMQSQTTIILFKIKEVTHFYM